MFKNLFLKITLLIATSLVTTSVIANDYGVLHGIVNYYAGELLPPINNAIFPNSPKLSRFITDIELLGLVYYWCNREAKARGSWKINEWGERYGSYDSTFDCITPAAVTGFHIVNDGVMFNIIDYRW